MRIIKVDNEEYEVVSDEARMLTTHLVDLFKRLGIPNDLTEHDLTPAAWRFIERLVEVWRFGYPHEYQDWVRGMEYELKYERPIKQHIKGGTYTPISYPMRFHNLMQVFLPKVRMQDKDFIKKFVKRIPEFKNTNYRI